MKALAVSTVFCLLGWPMLGEVRQSTPAPKMATVSVAVVVNPKCELDGLSLEHLRAIVAMERQFWPSNRRIILMLRPTSSPEMQVLLEKVYLLSEHALRKMWVEKLFAGRIPAIPTSVKSAQAVTANIAKLENGMSFVLSDAVAEGVQVLPIDGKLPGDPGYPLTMPLER